MKLQINTSCEICVGGSFLFKYFLNISYTVITFIILNMKYSSILDNSIYRIKYSSKSTTIHQLSYVWDFIVVRTSAVDIQYRPRDYNIVEFNNYRSLPRFNNIHNRIFVSISFEFYYVFRSMRSTCTSHSRLPSGIRLIKTVLRGTELFSHRYSK